MAGEDYSGRSGVCSLLLLPTLGGALGGGGRGDGAQWAGYRVWQLSEELSVHRIQSEPVAGSHRHSRI